MGNDGHLLVLRADAIPTEYRDLDPAACGIARVDLQGLDVYLAYWDTVLVEYAAHGPHELAARHQEAQWRLERVRRDGAGEPGRRAVRFGKPGYETVWREEQVLRELAELEADPERLAESQRYLAFVEWFRDHAQEITVWT